MSDDLDVPPRLDYATPKQSRAVGSALSLAVRIARRLCFTGGVGLLAGVYERELKSWLAEVGAMMIAACIPLGHLPWERPGRHDG